MWSNCKTGTIQSAAVSICARTAAQRRAARAEHSTRVTFLALSLVETVTEVVLQSSTEMSLSGSQTRLHTIGRRSNSRPDLTSVGYSLPRNDGAPYVTSGNGYHSEFNDGYAQTITHTFSRNSQGGGGGQRLVSINTLSSALLLFINKVCN